MPHGPSRASPPTSSSLFLYFFPQSWESFLVQVFETQGQESILFLSAFLLSHSFPESMHREVQPTERKGQGVEENPRNQNLSVNSSKTVPCFIAEGAHVQFQKHGHWAHLGSHVVVWNIFLNRAIIMKTIICPVYAFLLPCSGYKK